MATSSASLSSWRHAGNGGMIGGVAGLSMNPKSAGHKEKFLAIWHGSVPSFADRRFVGRWHFRPHPANGRRKGSRGDRGWCGNRHGLLLTLRDEGSQVDRLSVRARIRKNKGPALRGVSPSAAGTKIRPVAVKDVHQGRAPPVLGAPILHIPLKIKESGRPDSN